ncbi:MAG TPA: calcium-binding protein, partial [Alphaproteobacteria bacterium]|nr:calcium-binding protein [Alphaproteobacteria bacterium]
SDQIAGGAGTDLLVYSKALTSYTVTFATDGTLTVKDNSGTDGTDKVAADVESFKFGSTTYSLTQLKAAVTPVPTPTDPTPTPTTPTTPATLTGTAASETLTGTAGADIIDGGAGRDTIDGGLGTDTVTYAKSTAGVNIDLERSSQLGGHAEGDVLRNVENVEGSAFADRIFGNDFANVLTGGAGADTIDGDAGHDTIVGGAGNDKLDGDEGNDVFVFGPASGQDIVYDFSTDGDRIQISGVTGFTSAANVLSRAVQSGENVLIDLGGGNTITLDGIDRSDLTAANILIG